MKLALALLAGAASAQNLGDLITVLNSTEGTASFAEALSAYPQIQEAIAGKTNLTVLAPNDTAIELLETGTWAEAFEAGGDDYLINTILYHIIDGGYDNITDYYVVHTLLTSSNYTSVTGGQYLGLYYDDDEDVIGAYGGEDLHPESPNKPIQFSKGWIYIINDVLEIPPKFSTAVTSQDFNGTSFVHALNTTSLTNQFDELSDATYFIPIDDGFNAVECSLSQLSSEQLTEVLKYHVVQGKVWHFDDFENGTQLTTLQGQNLTISSTPAGDWFINNAGISYTDLASFSGSVFFIDNVLNPNAAWSPPVNGSEEGVPAFPTCTEDDGSSTASSTSADLATATYTGAAVPMNSGAFSIAALVGGAALAFAL